MDTSTHSPLDDTLGLTGLQTSEIGPVPTRGLVELALSIAEERRVILAELRAAIERDDTDSAINLARQLCGLQ